MSRIINYDALGVFLLNDEDGSIVERIKQDHEKVTSKIVFEIFRRWLRGEGQTNGNTTPVRTWERLVYYLRRVKNVALAEDIELILQACTEEKRKCSWREKEQIYQDKAAEAECFQELKPPTCNLHVIVTAAVTILMCIISGIVIVCYYSGKRNTRDASTMLAAVNIVDITITKQPKNTMILIGGRLYLICRATNPHNMKMKYEWFLIQAKGSMCSI
jgi:hypothetical protein